MAGRLPLCGHTALHSSRPLLLVTPSLNDHPTPIIKKPCKLCRASNFLNGAAGRNRTADTRIFRSKVTCLRQFGSHWNPLRALVSRITDVYDVAPVCAFPDAPGDAGGDEASNRIVERPPQVPGTTIHPTPNLLITLEGPVVVIDVAQQNCLGIQKFEGHPNVHIHRAFIDARCPLNPLHP